MPVEDFTNIDLGTSEKTFDDLDKLAEKAIKSLEKRNKEIKKAEESLKKKGGAFSSDLEKQQKRKQKQSFLGFQPQEETGEEPLRGGSPGAPFKSKKSFLEQIDEQVDKQIQVSFREAFADQAGGFRGVNNLLNFAKNPKAFASGLLKAIPFIGGVVAAAEFAQAIIAEIEKIDRFFKAFIPVIDDRINQLRKVEEQAHIRAGDTQLIATTTAGGIDPREAYNTFNQFNDNQSKLEADFAVRDTSGV